MSRPNPLSDAKSVTQKKLEKRLRRNVGQAIDDFKMIEDGASYFHCSGEWYRQAGSGSAVTYTAVKAP